MNYTYIVGDVERIGVAALHHGSKSAVVATKPPVVGSDWPSLAPPSRPAAAPKQLAKQGVSPKSKSTVQHPPTHVSIRSFYSATRPMRSQFWQQKP